MTPEVSDWWLVVAVVGVAAVCTLTHLVHRRKHLPPPEPVVERPFHLKKVGEVRRGTIYLDVPSAINALIEELELPTADRSLTGLVRGLRAACDCYLANTEGD